MDNSKAWIIGKTSSADVSKLSRETKISPMLAKVFLNRGITDPSFISDFLAPSLSGLHDPFLLNDMDKAISRILKAINSKEKIVVYGDYDVDGITSTSILYMFLTSLSPNISYYIPDRMDEGYGLTPASIKNLLQCEPSLVITVDCGIVSFEEVEILSREGVDVIVTDHHECREELPKAIAVINPHRFDSTYPFSNLAGVGVTFKLIHALCIELNLGNRHLDYLDIVAIGTIADVVPLLGENRIIVSHGLAALQKTKNLGLKTLMEVAGLKDRELTSYVVAFAISPRINAAGRLGDPKRAVKMFISEQYTEIMDISKELNEENKNRQETETVILEQALLNIESDPLYRSEPVLVVHGNGWHHGVIGIVASRITDRYYKPCIIISVENNSGKGSARSISEFNLFEALTHVSDLFERFGGHKAAAGLTIPKENIPLLRSMINEFAAAKLTEYDMIPKIQIDSILDENEITLDSIREMDKLAPFGQENTKPLFVAKAFVISEIRPVGDGKHLKLTLTKGKYRFDAIGFNLGQHFETLKLREAYDFAFYPEINVWNNSEKVQLNIKDIRKNCEQWIENEYYSSLDRLFDGIGIDTSKQTTPIGIDPFNAMSEITSETNLTDSFKNKTTLILTNTISSTNKIMDLLENNKFCQEAHYNINFECPHSDKTPKVNVVINPDFDKINSSNYDSVVFAGSLLKTEKLDSFLNNVRKKDLHKFKSLDDTKNQKELTISREDVASVYKYLTVAGHTKISISNTAVFSQEVSMRFNITLNSYKLLKILEILHQLNILKYRYSEKYNILVEMIENASKSDLSSSDTFNRFNNLNFVNL